MFVWTNHSTHITIFGDLVNGIMKCFEKGEFTLEIVQSILCENLQRAILCPLLFPIYFSDFCMASSLLASINFADEISLLLCLKQKNYDFNISKI